MKTISSEQVSPSLVCPDSLQVENIVSSSSCRAAAPGPKFSSLSKKDDADDDNDENDDDDDDDDDEDDDDDDDL